MCWCGMSSQEVGDKGNWRCTGLEWYLRRWGERVVGDVLVWSEISGGVEKG